MEWDSMQHGGCQVGGPYEKWYRESLAREALECDPRRLQEKSAAADKAMNDILAAEAAQQHRQTRKHAAGKSKQHASKKVPVSNAAAPRSGAQSTGAGAAPRSGVHGGGGQERVREEAGFEEDFESEASRPVQMGLVSRHGVTVEKVKSFAKPSAFQALEDVDEDGTLVSSEPSPRAASPRSARGGARRSESGGADAGHASPFRQGLKAPSARYFGGNSASKISTLGGGRDNPPAPFLGRPQPPPAPPRVPARVQALVLLCQDAQGATHTGVLNALNPNNRLYVPALRAAYRELSKPEQKTFWEALTAHVNARPPPPADSYSASEGSGASLHGGCPPPVVAASSKPAAARSLSRPQAFGPAARAAHGPQAATAATSGYDPAGPVAAAPSVRPDARSQPHLPQFPPATGLRAPPLPASAPSSTGHSRPHHQSSISVEDLFRRAREAQQPQSNCSAPDQASELLKRQHAITVEGVAGVPLECEDDSCVVCMERPPNALLMPCRHRDTCLDCALAIHDRSNHCPICRVPIENIFDVT